MAIKVSDDLSNTGTNAFGGLSDIDLGAFCDQPPSAAARHWGDVMHNPLWAGVVDGILRLGSALRYGGGIAQALVLALTGFSMLFVMTVLDPKQRRWRSGQTHRASDD